MTQDLHEMLAEQQARTVCYAGTHYFGGKVACQCGQWRDAERYHRWNALRVNRGVFLDRLIRFALDHGGDGLIDNQYTFRINETIIRRPQRDSAATLDDMAWAGTHQRADVCSARLLIVPADYAKNPKDQFVIYAEDPKALFAQIVNHFFYFPEIPSNDCIIAGNVKIGPNCSIGEPGFGFVKVDGTWQRFPQLGRVVIEDDVEIGSNVCIDRGALGDTIIRKGAKIDNLVHIAHNVEVGERTLVIAGAILCGSCIIEEDCWIAPGAIIKEGVRIGKGSLVGLGSVVTHDVPPNSTVVGIPAKPFTKKETQ